MQFWDCNSAKISPMSIPRTARGQTRVRKYSRLLARASRRGKMLNITEVDVLRIQIAF